MKQSKPHKIIGREKEASLIESCLRIDKNILIEGPVGIGKTYLASVICEKLNRKVYRVDGDSRYTEQKLVGYFDPPLVLKKGYKKDVFVHGPLLEAMQEGAILFINELNRMPEGIQNILLPAIDEKLLHVPRLGTVQAKEGFSLIATMNPREFVATSHISEAVLDRFECIFLDYQSEAEEKLILRSKIEDSVNEALLDWSIRAVRKTRENPNMKRGASIRAAMSIYTIALERGGSWEAFCEACEIALMNRIELSVEAFEGETKSILNEILEAAKKK